jgi:hypothetical protein
LEIIGRIKGRPVESTTSASASPKSRQEGALARSPQSG